MNILEMVNDLLYRLDTGYAWRYVTKNFLLKSTLFDYFDLWTYHVITHPPWQGGSEFQFPGTDT